MPSEYKENQQVPSHCTLLTDAGIAQLVEHDLAKVGVASSSLVSRSRFAGQNNLAAQRIKVRWQSGYAADCKSVHLGSTPGRTSTLHPARVVKSVDTRDLKSLGLWSCGFKSRPGHLSVQIKNTELKKAVVSNVVTAFRAVFCTLSFCLTSPEITTEPELGLSLSVQEDPSGRIWL